MKTRPILASLLILIAITLGVLFYSTIVFPSTLEGYFKKAYYNQFGALAISIELLMAGFYLFIRYPKTNFAMALFAFTAVLDPIFHTVGLFTSQVPLYASILLVGCAMVAFWVAFTNAYGTGRISFIGALGSFLLGVLIELFFNSF